jgi:DNA gyrase subunit A
LDRAHILEGLLIALDHIDEIVAILKSSKDDDTAMQRLEESFQLTEIQAKSIMDMQMRRLTGLQRQKIQDEYDDLEKAIADYRDILARPERVYQIIKAELADMKAKYGDARRTQIIDAESDIEDADLIPVEQVMIAITTNGYIKRTPVDTYKTQGRGGKGVKGMSLNSDDIIDQGITMSSHDDLLLFTNRGKVYRIKGFRVPEASRIAKGVPVVNLLNTEPGENVRAMVEITPDPELAKQYMFFVTRKGLVKRVPMAEFVSIRRSGKIAISLNEGDELFGAQVTSGHDEIIIAADNGKAIRFNEVDVRPMGRNAAGVKGLNTDGGNVVGLATDRMGPYILSVTEKGYGKKTPLAEYRLTKRGAKGVTSIKITGKNGPLMTMRAVNGDEDALIMTDNGTMIRISLSEVSVYGRSTQGVRLIRVDEGAKVATVALIDGDEEAEEEAETGQTQAQEEEDV